MAHRSFFLSTFLLLWTLSSIANDTRAAGIPVKPADLKTAWGDQGDGTFVNPVLPSDYSDLDAIRIGDDYYAMSSTFQFSPGVVILHSKDLVSWTIASHAVADLKTIAPQMNWNSMDRYGRGVWAGAIRYHDDKFWVYFCTPDEGFFVTTAKKVTGPWVPVQSLWKTNGWDDCCPFWDDDGQGYFVCTNFKDKYKIHLFKLSADGKQLVMDSDKVIHQSAGSEANKLYKINGLYYHYFSEVHSEGRVVMMERAKSLDGPWEQKQLNHVDKRIDKDPNQGGLIQLPSGDWWFITHQGTGDWEGRAMVLLPIHWVQGWPIIGDVGADGIGTMVWKTKSPLPAVPAVVQSSDEFAGSTLGQQWEWNYQPRDEKWSLSERPGFLRLHAFQPLKTGDLMKAGNTLTQRSLRTEKNVVTIKLEIGNMTDGQQAGLCHFAGNYSTIGVEQAGDVRTLVFNFRGKPAAGPVAGPVITSTAIWLRSSWDFDGKSQYAYSNDGTTFTPFGAPYQLTWGHYRGDRIGVFSYNDKSDSGYVDVDFFYYDFARPAGAGKESGMGKDGN